MQTDHLQIPKHRILEILNDATLYSNDKLNLDQTSFNARQIIAALSGMLSSQDEVIANLLAERIGLTPMHQTLSSAHKPAQPAQVQA